MREPDEGADMGALVGFVPIYEKGPGMYTRAFVTCSQCGAAIRPVGGPMMRALCLACTADRIPRAHARD